MELPTTATNLVKSLAMDICSDEKMRNFLVSGNLYSAEIWVRDLSVNIFNGVMEELLVANSLNVCEATICIDFACAIFKFWRYLPNSSKTSSFPNRTP